jgi:hypothetical protein
MTVFDTTFVKTFIKTADIDQELSFVNGLEFEIYEVGILNQVHGVLAMPVQ